MIIPREKLHDWWKTHMDIATNPRTVRVVNRVGDEIERTSSLIAQNEQTRIDLTQKLFDDKWISKNHVWWEGIRIVRSKYKLEEDTFLDEIRRNIAVIEEADPYLASMIRGEFAKQGSVKRAPILDRLRILCNNKKPFECGVYITQNSQEIIRELGELENREHTQEIMLAVSNISKGYRRFINFENYLSKWFRFINLNRSSLEVVVQRIKLFMADLEKKKAEGLASKIKENEQIKHLINLPEELQYLGTIEYIGRDGKKRKGLLLKIMRGEKEGNWEEFNEFYDHLKEEGDEIVRLFGDIATKNRLIYFKKRQRKWLEGWKREIRQIISELSSQDNIGKMVVRALSSLRQILDEEAIRKKEDFNHELRKLLVALKNLLKERVKPVGKKDILKLCRIREEYLKEWIRRMCVRFREEESELYGLWQEAKEEERSLSRNDRSLKYMEEIERGRDLRNKWISYTSGNLSLLNGDIRRNSALIGNVLAALSQLEGSEEGIRLDEIRLIRGVYRDIIQPKGQITGLVPKLKDYNGKLMLIINLLKEILLTPKVEEKPKRVIDYA